MRIDNLSILSKISKKLAITLSILNNALMFTYFVFDRKARPNFTGSIFLQKVTTIMLRSNDRD